MHARWSLSPVVPVQVMRSGQLEEQMVSRHVERMSITPSLVIPYDILDCQPVFDQSELFFLSSFRVRWNRENSHGSLARSQ